MRVRLQAQGRRQADLTGVVDSGATTTALSRENAEELGLRTRDLLKGEPATIADGSQVACWTTLVPIRAQVHSQSVPGGPLEPWGPIVDLQPVLLDHGDPLWGHRDFFKNFKISFDYEVVPPWFELRYRLRGRPRL